MKKEGDTDNDFLYTGEQYNANPVMYTDPSGYLADMSLANTVAAVTVSAILATAVVFHDQVMWIRVK